MRKSAFIAAAIALLALVGCDAERAAPVDVAPKGGPEVDAATVAEHARQFDDELGERVPGSQEEFAAATYLLAHLQDAGYVVELDYVPVEDLVRSTNVFAAAPGGEPETIVVAAYDSTEEGTTIGTLLELARASRARREDHRIGFVAMGAESAHIGDGALGSRRLAQRLLDDDLEPVVVELSATGSGEPLRVFGDEAEEFLAATGLDAVGDGVDRVWDRAGFHYVVLSGGDAGTVAEAVLKYLGDSDG